MAANPDIQTCALLLARLRPLFEQATQALAQCCAEEGVFSARRFDAQQVASYELAWASADLLAAETAIQGPGSDANSLETGLALVFGIDAIGSVLARTEMLFLELGLDIAPLQAFASDAAWAALRRSAGSAAALQAVGWALANADGEVGGVVLDEAHAMAQDAFRRFAADVVAPQAEALHRHDLTVPESLLQPLREMGVFGLSVPERFGGHAPNDRDDTLLMVLVTEALSEASLAGAGSLITRPEILSRALMAGGTEEQKSHWLPRIAAGDPLCAIAITEPDYGSDVASLMLRGTRVEGGWRLDGAKTWCTFAGKAGLVMVVVRTDPDRSAGHRGLSLMLVEKPSDDGHAFAYRQSEAQGGGALTGKAIATIGYRGMHSFELSFDNLFVPESHVIGGAAGLGKGFYFTMAGMMGGRMQTAGRASGVMRAAIRAALRYAADRKVFGSPLLDCPLTLAKLARMGARYAACQRLAYAVARTLDEGGGRMEASLVKLLACRSAEWVTREALQLHGGNGYAEESPVSRYFVDARVLSIFEGAEETLALKVIARSLLEQALADATPARSVAPVR
ncbi:acyl-CoA dehydrogenase family protein [Variovorax paradoxus]|uniref:acyl-CoA dehydrogenase family protein n=1 Tax=Variovorax paradoxus TaxID=34073 RepID=UPI0007818A00|nr:acyl-CoA dehydrogenase family protein [Variovorax paradoxus]